ncbi:MAG: ferrous iron transport protein A [Anaerolineales bacterium]|nr:ferrous iron transport protein A [Anaerolineales bacterium]
MAAPTADGLAGIPTQAEGLFPLTEAAIGTPVQVAQVLNGQGVARRLRPMGLAQGDRVCVVRGAPFWGPIVVEIPGRVIALGRGVASQILVRSVPAPDTDVPAAGMPDLGAPSGAV